MKHLDTWYDISMRGLPLALILEDDPLFVPFFKEKFNRFIYNAIRTGALQPKRSCLSRPSTHISNSEWINQEPMFVIGACFDYHDNKFFQKHRRDAQPILTTQKRIVTRCAHAYLLTACTARLLIEQISLHYVQDDTPDFLLNSLVNASTILQSFWVDPPLVYQGNRVDKDLDGIPTFKETKYKLRL